MAEFQFKIFLSDLEQKDPAKYEIIKRLYAESPTVFSRQEAPGMHPRTLANKDCAGKGPAGRFKRGRTTMYLREPYFIWYANQIKA